MADIAITPANVVAQGGAAKSTGTAGATITAGQALSRAANETLILASDTTAPLAQVAGIALHAASTGQPINYVMAGDVNLGATLTVGKQYVLSTAGGICPVDDIAGGEFASIIGIAISASILRLSILNSPVAAAGAVA